LPARRRQTHPLRLPVKERDPQMCLELFHMAADGTARHMQFLCGTNEAGMPRRRLERAQCIERGKSHRHLNG